MPTINTQDNLRKLLQIALNSPDIDYGRVLELSLQLSEFDEENVRFSVDASIISRLGRELVAKKETAVSELVKNAFDADANYVSLSFEDTELAAGTLVIDDDGHGMTRDQLIDGFMRLSTSDKIHEPYSPKYHRLRAGRKGIGRFAANRLGKKLIITTQTREANSAMQIEIDWAHFKIDQDLIIISNRIKEIKKTKKQGTTLVINDLEDGWSVPSLTKVYKYLVDLIQPFPVSKSLEADKTDPGFDIKIYRSIGGQKEEIASADKLIFENALAEIEGKISKNGIGKWTIRCKQLGIDETSHITSHDDNDKTPRLSLLKNVNLKAYYYIYNGKDANYLPTHINTIIADLARDRGGIRVYRNGFRVLPYGEPDDDWLGLDQESARRKVLPPYGNRNFFGFIELIDPQGEFFEETSSREGLIENQCFQELIKFCRFVLEASIVRIAEGRGKKAKPTKSEILPEERLKEAIEQGRRAAKDLMHLSATETKAPESEIGLSTLKTIQNAFDELEGIVNEQQQKKDELLDELTMLRVLASLGLAIGQFNHEIRNMFPALTADAYLLINSTPPGDAHETALRLKKNIQSFRTYTSYFDKSVSANARRETEPQEVGRLLRSFWEVITPACQRRDIEFPEPTIHGYDLFTVPMHLSEWTSILFNLFTNSRKAIKRAGRDVGKILVVAGKETDNIFIEFSDNGDGIPIENRERIYDAFFTTSLTNPIDANEEEDDDLLGTGLGLKILKDIITSHNGEVMLVGAPREFVTCFRIEIPVASEKQLEEYGY